MMNKHFFGRFWQVECTDKENGKHSWRFPHDEEGKREACGFLAWLRRKHKGEYTSYLVWDK